MPEQMSGLKPTWQDTQWYEQQKEKERTQQAQGFAGQTGVIGEALMSLGGYAKDAFKENSDHPIARMALDMLGGLGDADYMAKTQATTMHGETGGQFLGALEVADTAVSLGATGALRNAPRLAREAAEAGARDIQSLGVGQATLQAARGLGDKIPPMGPQLQMQLAGATNTGSFVGTRMQDLQPPTVMKYSDEQLDTLGDLGKNKEFLDTLDPEHRYFTPETLAEAQAPMRKREKPLRTAEAKLEDYRQKEVQMAAEGNFDKMEYYKDKGKKLDRKVSDLTAGPIDEIVPDNPQTYWSDSADAKAWRKSAGVDQQGNPRVDSHHQTIESMETGAIFRRLKVVKENPQASLIIWEHMRRNAIVPGGGRRAQRMVSKAEHTLDKDALHVAVLNKWRGFFKKLPEDIGLSDLLRKIDEFSASLDDSDAFYKKKGMEPIDRDIPEGSLMQNQVERLIRDLQKE